MKCEKCGKEATFYYSSNINGEKTERRLCADCARSEGFGGALDWELEPVDLFHDMFSDFGGMFGDFFSPRRSLFPTFGSFGEPLRSIMAPAMAMPRINIVIGKPEQAAASGQTESTADNIPADAGDDVKNRRELEALRAQLENAVKAEDFEKAIELRDQIRKLEK